MIEQQKTYLSGLQALGTFKQEELLRFDLVEGLLRAETSLETSGRTQRKVNVSDAAGAWLVSIQDYRRANDNGVMLVVNRYDFERSRRGVLADLAEPQRPIPDAAGAGVDGTAWFHQMAGWPGST